MRDGWPTRPLGEVAEVFDGPHATPKTVDSGPIFLGISALQDGAINLDETRHVTERDFKKWTRRVKPQKDDFVFSYETRLGQAAIIPEGLECCLGRRMGLVRFRKATVCPRFFLYQYLSPSFSAFLSRQTIRGATVDRLSIRAVPSFPIAVPPLPEQHRIVGILDAAFEGIATAKSNAERNVQNSRALFESHLEAVFSKRGNGSHRDVPLSSLLSVQPRNGWSPPAEFQTGTGVPVLTLSSVTGFKFDGTRVKMTSAPTRAEAHYWLRKGELLITRSNTRDLVGHAAIYDGKPAKAICCDLIMKMTVDPSHALTRFVYFYLRSSKARAYLTGRAQGASSTMKKIGKQVVQNLTVPTPSIAEQRLLVSTLDKLGDDTDRLESVYRRHLAALEALKKSLLDHAFTGQL